MPAPARGLPADFEQRYGFIHPDHSGVDLKRLRRHHQTVVRLARRRLRQLEAENEHLQQAADRGLDHAGTAAGRARSTGSSARVDDVDVGEDNPDRG